MFITTKVFDPSLEGHAVKLTGELIEGNYIIARVHSKTLEVVGSGKSSVAIIKGLQMSDFETGAIEMVVLEPPAHNVVEVEALPFEDWEPLEVLEDEPTKKKNFRSDLQIKVDNAHLEYMLQENIEPMKLEEILKRMRENHGHTHWNSKNASGFVLHAIKMGKRIKKTGHAHYSYDWEAAK